jgi:hypothetical protein
MLFCLHLNNAVLRRVGSVGASSSSSISTTPADPIETGFQGFYDEYFETAVERVRAAMTPKGTPVKKRTASLFPGLFELMSKLSNIKARFKAHEGLTGTAAGLADGCDVVSTLTQKKLRWQEAVLIYTTTPTLAKDTPPREVGIGFVEPDYEPLARAIYTAVNLCTVISDHFRAYGSTYIPHEISYSEMTSWVYPSSPLQSESETEIGNGTRVESGRTVLNRDPPFWKAPTIWAMSQVRSAFAFVDALNALSRATPAP